MVKFLPKISESVFNPDYCQSLIDWSVDYVGQRRKMSEGFSR